MMFGHINVNRLATHFSLIEALCDDLRYDVLAITETFLTNDEEDNHLSLNGYNFFRVDREGQAGGGVGLYVRDYFTVKVLEHSEGCIPEFLIVELLNAHIEKILFAVVYRRPAAAYPTHFFACLSPLLANYTNVVITGDFNINMAVTNAASTRLKELIDSHSLALVPSDPTHHVFRVDRPPTHTWLDLFIVKNPGTVAGLRRSEAPFIAGHDLVEISYKCIKPPVCTKVIRTRELSRVNPATLATALQASLLPLTAVPHGTDSAFLTTVRTPVPVVTLGCIPGNSDKAERDFTAALITAYDVAAPTRRIALSSKRKPWVSPAIRALMKERDKAYHVHRDFELPGDVDRFKLLRAQICNSLDTVKNQFLVGNLAQAQNVNNKWAVLRHMRVASNRFPSPLLYYSANARNKHYAAIVNRHPPLSEADFQVLRDKFARAVVTSQKM